MNTFKRTALALAIAQVGHLAIAQEATTEAYNDQANRGAMHDDADVRTQAIELPDRFHIPENSEFLSPADVTYRLWALPEALVQSPALAEAVETSADATQTAAATTVVTLNQLVFKSGQAEVEPESLTAIDELARQLVKEDVARIRVTGHTDNQRLSALTKGRFGSNQGLSEARAKAIAELLRARLDTPELETVWRGFGESRPIASNASVSGMQQNRRVEVEVWFADTQLTPPVPPRLATNGFERTQVCNTQPLCRYTLPNADAVATAPEPKRLVKPIRYAFGKHQLTEAAKARLRKALTELQRQNKVVEVSIEGHTDAIRIDPNGTNAPLKTNDTLSIKRANGVKQFLVSEFGIDANTIRISGRGASQPLVSNATSEGRAQNRRVEVLITEQQTTAQPQQVVQQCGLDLHIHEEQILTRRRERLDIDIEPIRFHSGSHVIPDGYLAYLSEILEELQQGSTVAHLKFVGHTDSDPLYHTKAIYGDNQGLSEHRAREVMSHVIAKLGLSPEVASFAGMGETQPVAANDVEENKALNRRVELEIWSESAETEVVRHTGSVERVDTVSGPIDAFGLSPFRITVDGQPLDEFEPTHVADVERCVDVALERAELQLQPDNLDLKPRLAIAAAPKVIARTPSDEQPQSNIVAFRGYSNYLAYVDRAEVVVWRLDQQGRPADAIDTIALDSNLQGSWAYDAEQVQQKQTVLYNDDSDDGDDNELVSRPDMLAYSFRVYDSEGNYDETEYRPLRVVDSVDGDLDADAEHELLAAYGETMLSEQNISLAGASIRVNGINISPEHDVFVMGHAVPVDSNGRFVSEQIIPTGFHTIEVAVLDQEGNGALYHRPLELPDSDWFVVGIADVTLGFRDTNGPASTVTQDDSYDDDAFATGRLAFFTEGKTESGLKITASADTREQPLEDLFSNFVNKDPTVLFRRLDEDLYYPTFGDDSTIEEGAPTQGKFYVKVERDDDHVMWGNFDATIGESELARIDRGLYGFQVDYSDNIGADQEDAGTSKNGVDYRVQAFAAEPGTIGAREDFRATGGSVFFTRHQDLTLGSENVYVETRDAQTDRLLNRQQLSLGRDYEIDYIQGRVLLESPLSSFSQDNNVISDSSLSGNPNFLVVTYEYTPGFEELDDIAVGGRISAALTDNIEAGITALKQDQLGLDQQVYGADISLDDMNGYNLRVELGQTKGLAVNQLESLDGGFDFENTPQVTDPDIEASAVRVEFDKQFERGIGIDAYIQERERGYSASGQIVDTDTTDAAIGVDINLTARTTLGLEAEIHDEEIGQTEEQFDAELAYRFDEQWQLDVALRRDEITNSDPQQQNIQDIGVRDEIGLALAYTSEDDWRLYGFGQHTLKADSTRDKNDRLGLGGSYKFSDKLYTDAELSGGTTGTGAEVGIQYTASEYTNYYFTLSNENQRAFNGASSRRGNATAGFKNKYSDRLSWYGEERYAYGDQPTGLTHAYGVDFAADEYWTYGGGLELGTLRNDDGSETERLALSTSIGFTDEISTYAGSVEYRTDETDTSDRVTWLMRHSFDYQTHEDWRLLAGLDWSKSDSSQGEFFDGDFTEFVLGYAYRPVANDRWNTLTKYTYFFNKPAPEQVATTNANSQFIQRSHVFSLDVNYELDPRWTLGGKYAYKLGELAVDRVNPEYFSSDLQLLVLRADWHVVNDWDWVIEGRVLDAITAEDTRSGFLTVIYRHFYKNLKAGIGYNFTDFSDDLTDLSFDEQGVFINIIGKM